MDFLFVLLGFCALISNGDGHAYPYPYQLTQQGGQTQRFGAQPLYNPGFLTTTSFFNQAGGALKLPRNGFGEPLGTHNSGRKLPQGFFRTPLAHQSLPQQGRSVGGSSSGLTDPFHGVKVTYLRSDATLVPPQGQSTAPTSLNSRNVFRSFGHPSEQQLPTESTFPISSSNTSPNVQIRNQDFGQNLQTSIVVGQNVGISENLPSSSSSTTVHQPTPITDTQLDQILNQNHFANSFIQKPLNAPNQTPQVINFPFSQNSQNPQTNQFHFNPNPQISQTPFSQNQQISQVSFNPTPHISQALLGQSQQHSQISSPFSQNQQISPAIQFSQRPLNPNQPNPQQNNYQFNPTPQNLQLGQGPLKSNPPQIIRGPFGQPQPTPQLNNFPFNPNPQRPVVGSQGPLNPYQQTPQPSQLNPSQPIPNFPYQQRPNSYPDQPEPENGFNPNHLQSFPEPPYESEFLNLPALDAQDSVELEAYVAKLRRPPPQNLNYRPEPSSAFVEDNEAEALSSRIVNSSIRNGGGELEGSPQELVRLAEGRPLPSKCAYNTITQGLQGEDCVEIRKR